MPSLKEVYQNACNPPHKNFGTIFNRKDKNAQRMTDLQTKLTMGVHKDLCEAIRTRADLNATKSGGTYVYKTADLLKIWEHAKGFKNENEVNDFLLKTDASIKQGLKSKHPAIDEKRFLQKKWKNAFERVDCIDTIDENTYLLLNRLSKSLSARFNPENLTFRRENPAAGSSDKSDVIRNYKKARAEQDYLKNLWPTLEKKSVAALKSIGKNARRITDRPLARVELLGRQIAHGGAVAVTVGAYCVREAPAHMGHAVASVCNFAIDSAIIVLQGIGVGVAWMAEVAKNALTWGMYGKYKENKAELDELKSQMRRVVNSQHTNTNYI